MNNQIKEHPSIIECEDCVSLAICINEINFYKDDEYSFRYVFQWGTCANRCSYLNNLVAGFHGENGFMDLKLFFMKQKGIQPINL
jgi:hypothetical protein